jgi:UPF0716 family protein affecting phage T7 exclusion
MKNIFNKITNWTNRIEIVNISISTVVLLLLLTFIGVVTELVGLSLFLPIFQNCGSMLLMVRNILSWRYL